ncbi:MAG: hypothetical protein H5T64_08895 [Chloroflexi bacterium]|nr:hypothetical protein [Chloroflexota bacterium]
MSHEYEREIEIHRPKQVVFWISVLILVALFALASEVKADSPRAVLFEHFCWYTT